MLTVTDLVLRAGTRTLLDSASFTVGRGDRIGLVGRNGAGKTTLARALAGEIAPDAGTVTRSGETIYLPQDSGAAPPPLLARERILSGRGLDRVAQQLQEAQAALAAVGDPEASGAIARYGRLEDQFEALGGYGAQAEAASIAAGLGVSDHLLGQPCGTLSGGQRRRVELARVLFSGADTLLLDEPTNHLDAPAIAWLRDFLRGHRGALVLISHDVGLLDAVVTRVFRLDGVRAQLDISNVGWQAAQDQRATDDRRRQRERTNAERKAAQLRSQADRLHAKATKASAARGMYRRAEQLLGSAPEVRRGERVGRLRFPDPASCGRLPLGARGLSKSFGALRVLHRIDVDIARGSRTVVLGQNGAGKTTLLRLLAGLERPDEGEVQPGHGLRLGYYAQEHETLDLQATVLDNLRRAAPSFDLPTARGVLGSFLFSGESVDQPVRTLSGGERTRLALAVLVVSAANVLLLDEPTNNLDPASRDEILKALAGYRGAVLLVTHDRGAVRALAPERVILLPDGVQDYWDPSLEELVAVS